MKHCTTSCQEATQPLLKNPPNWCQRIRHINWWWIKLNKYINYECIDRNAITRCHSLLMMNWVRLRVAFAIAFAPFSLAESACSPESYFGSRSWRYSGSWFPWWMSLAWWLKWFQSLMWVSLESLVTPVSFGPDSLFSNVLAHPCKEVGEDEQYKQIGLTWRWCLPVWCLVK